MRKSRQSRDELPCSWRRVRRPDKVAEARPYDDAFVRAKMEDVTAISKVQADLRVVTLPNILGDRWQWRFDWQSRADEFSQDVDCYEALRLLAGLAERGFLIRLCPCQQCGKWLYPSFPRHIFCANACRGKHFPCSLEGKIKRAEYMRRYRAKLKRLETAMKELAASPLRRPG